MRVARPEYAQILSSRIQLQDFGEVDEAQAAVPEQAVQRIARLDVQHQGLKGVDRFRSRVGLIGCSSPGLNRRGWA